LRCAEWYENQEVFISFRECCIVDVVSGRITDTSWTMRPPRRETHGDNRCWTS